MQEVKETCVVLIRIFISLFMLCSQADSYPMKEFVFGMFLKPIELCLQHLADFLAILLLSFLVPG